MRSGSGEITLLSLERKRQREKSDGGGQHPPSVYWQFSAGGINFRLWLWKAGP